MTFDLRIHLDALRELQHLDVELHRFRKRLSVLSTTIQPLEQEHRSLQEEFKKLTTELAKAEKSKRGMELELESSIVALRERESRLYAIKTQREYQATLQEIAAGKKLNREREEQVLALMEKSETLKQKMTQLEPVCSDKEKQYAQAATELKQQETEMTQHLQELEKKRPELISNIETVLVRKYEVIQKRHPDPLATVTKGICSGCHMNIPPQLFNEILRYKELKQCPTCHRLLSVGGEKEVENDPTSDHAQRDGH